MCGQVRTFVNEHHQAPVSKQLAALLQAPQQPIFVTTMQTV